MVVNIVLNGLKCNLIRNIKGILSKSPYVTLRGNVDVTDEKNGLKAVIAFANDQADGFFSGWGRKKVVQEDRNKVSVNIYKVNDGKKELLESGSGRWTRYIQFEKKIYWKHTDECELFEEEKLEGSLPSSSKRRKEIDLIEQEKYSEADKLIEKIETVEIKDAYRRKKHKKSIKK